MKRTRLLLQKYSIPIKLKFVDNLVGWPGFYHLKCTRIGYKWWVKTRQSSYYPNTVFISWLEWWCEGWSSGGWMGAAVSPTWIKNDVACLPPFPFTFPGTLVPATLLYQAKHQQRAEIAHQTYLPHLSLSLTFGTVNTKPHLLPIKSSWLWNPRHRFLHFNWSELSG